jgi:outer membrane lipoprotein carrier protein
MRRTISSLALLPFALLAALVVTLPAGAATGDPWELLAGARKTMQEGGPQLWSFAQTYLPTGFDRGEEESGRVALDLPRCVRWDYDQPYPKSFLLCGERLWAWNPGEPVGHLYDLDAAQPGLDLLLLAVEELDDRYTARAQPAGSSTRIHLTPKASGPNVLKDAAILLDSGGRVRELTYRDAEGNRSTFRFSGVKPIAGGNHFDPPAGVKWEKDGGGAGRG